MGVFSNVASESIRRQMGCHRTGGRCDAGASGCTGDAGGAARPLRSPKGRGGGRGEARKHTYGGPSSPIPTFDSDPKTSGGEGNGTDSDTSHDGGDGQNDGNDDGDWLDVLEDWFFPDGPPPRELPSGDWNSPDAWPGPASALDTDVPTPAPGPVDGVPWGPFNPPRDDAPDPENPPWVDCPALARRLEAQLNSLTVMSSAYNDCLDAHPRDPTACDDLYDAIAAMETAAQRTSRQMQFQGCDEGDGSDHWNP